MMSSQKKLESSIMFYLPTFHSESQLCHVLQSDFIFKKGNNTNSRLCYKVASPHGNPRTWYSNRWIDMHQINSCLDSR